VYEKRLNVKGILFDLDGTIVDSREAYLEAARTAFHATGQPMPEERSVLEIPRKLEQNLPLNNIVMGDQQRFLDVYLKRYYAVTMEKTKPFPDIHNALGVLSQKAKLALITMRYVQKAVLVEELEHFNLAGYFAHVVTALGTHKPKPSPEALISAVRAMDVDICACAIVGDSVSDVRAGKAAGALTVAVLSGLFSREELARETPDLILDSAVQLPSYVDCTE
jgi:pyrophosphatase PpaX